jgi:hypothetical protein
VSIRAHNVPRFHLNGFSAPESDSTRDPFVWLGTLATGEVRKRSPKKISIVREGRDAVLDCRLAGCGGSVLPQFFNTPTKGPPGLVDSSQLPGELELAINSIPEKEALSLELQGRAY